MPFVLGDINGWHPGISCTPTALCAITSKTPDEIGTLLQQAAKKFGRGIPSQLRADYNINDCLNGVILLGGDWVELEKFDDRKFLERPQLMSG